MDLGLHRLRAALSRKPGITMEAIGVLSGIRDSVEAIAGALEDAQSAPAEVGEDPRITTIQLKIDELTAALSEGILRVQRSENRVRAIVTGARKELAEHGFEHPGIEAEASELQQHDDPDSKAEPVQPVPESVDPDEEPSSIPGVTMGELQRGRASRFR